ncbi:hypothetical protein VNO78_18719 [Psophocarpus tetragonolobus]|uniref:Uncharacterized protein n=1 Tax=Psophocarpus tetragonolobus TaxID=3891 RepID=A0AAN9S6V5_PSOTE
MEDKIVLPNVESYVSMNKSPLSIHNPVQNQPTAKPVESPRQIAGLYIRIEDGVGFCEGTKVVGVEELVMERTGAINMPISYTSILLVKASQYSKNQAFKSRHGFLIEWTTWLVAYQRVSALLPLQFPDMSSRRMVGQQHSKLTIEQKVKASSGY